MLWHRDLGFTPPVNSMDNQGGPRALAWDVGEMTDDPCEEPRPHPWVGWRDQPKPDALIRKIDIEGNTVDEVRTTNWLGNWNHGIFGGAIDPDVNFWGLGTLGTLIRVDGETMDMKRWDYSDGHNQIPYGIVIDANGDVWLGGYQRGRLIHFDPKTETFSLMPQATGGPQILRGLMADRENRLWIAGNNLCSVSHFDIAKKQWVDPLIPLPECVEPVGISIDAKGFVWIVDREAQRAYKMDPMTKSTSVVMGLVKPYTYCDMTGAGLKLVEDPPG